MILKSFYCSFWKSLAWFRLSWVFLYPKCLHFLNNGDFLRIDFIFIVYKDSTYSNSNWLFELRIFIIQQSGHINEVYLVTLHSVTTSLNIVNSGERNSFKETNWRYQRIITTLKKVVFLCPNRPKIPQKQPFIFIKDPNKPQLCLSTHYTHKHPTYTHKKQHQPITTKNT